MASTNTMSNGTTSYYKDRGSASGQPIMLSHGWPLDADAFEAQMFFLVIHGYRCIGHEALAMAVPVSHRDGNDLDTCAEGLVQKRT